VKFISDHALRRFRARFCDPTANSPLSEDELATRVHTLYEKASPAEVIPKYIARQMLSHGIDKDTSYRIRGNIVFVVVEDTLITVHNNETKRWRRVDAKPKKKKR
jgi:hypothetical protein